MADENFYDDVFYVGIHDPNIIRVNLLESQKEIILNLKRFENYKELRDKKLSR